MQKCNEWYLNAKIAGLAKNMWRQKIAHEHLNIRTWKLRICWHLLKKSLVENCIFKKTDTNSLAETLMSFASCYENVFYRMNTWINRKDSMKHRFLEKNKFHSNLKMENNTDIDDKHWERIWRDSLKRYSEAAAQRCSH